MTYQEIIQKAKDEAFAEIMDMEQDIPLHIPASHLVALEDMLVQEKVQQFLLQQ